MFGGVGKRKQLVGRRRKVVGKMTSLVDKKTNWVGDVGRKTYKVDDKQKQILDQHTEWPEN